MFSSPKVITKSNKDHQCELDFRCMWSCCNIYKEHGFFSHVYLPLSTDWVQIYLLRFSFSQTSGYPSHILLMVKVRSAKYKHNWIKTFFFILSTGISLIRASYMPSLAPKRRNESFSPDLIYHRLHRYNIINSLKVCWTSTYSYTNISIWITFLIQREK